VISTTAATTTATTTTTAATATTTTARVFVALQGRKQITESCLEK
jgi:hypothetical protein